MTVTHKQSPSPKSEDASEFRSAKATQRIPTHIPPVPINYGQDRVPCACGGVCPRCAPNRAFSSLVRSATEESRTPLNSGLRHRLQSRFLQTLPNIWIHTGPEAQAAADALQTRAFTLGNNIVFSGRAPDPESMDGFALLVHETAHVLQQRNANASRNPSLSRNRSLESDAVSAAAAVRDGSGPTDIAANEVSANRVQREDPPIPDSLKHPFTSQGQFQLELDPEVQKMILQMRVRQWLLAEESGEPNPQQDPNATTDSPNPDDEYGPTPQVPLQNGVDPNAPLPADWAGPDLLAAQPNVGALLNPFAARGVTAGAGDLELANKLFQDRYTFALALPDLRDMVPDFARGWIPSDWRVKVAESLTQITIDSALKGDNPTARESADQIFSNIIGDPDAIPTYFNITVSSF